MCGIAGVLRFDGREPSLAALRRMTDALAHRGPDGQGHQVLGPCGLGHRRLSIIDLSEAGLQPMCTDDRKLWVSFNGEIYNYVELRKDLEALGCRFRSQTDTEVILHAYREWGEEAFSKFNGMWAIALWDTQTQSLLLCRDRLGIKPLFVHQNSKRLLFASEPKAMLAAEPELARADVASIARLLFSTGSCFVRGSFFEGVMPLEAGSLIVVNGSGRVQRRKFWAYTPPVEQEPLARGVAEDTVRSLLIDAVRLRFRADVPVGTCLSGGIDSSSIVSIAKRELGFSPETFSGIYADEGFDESRFVRLLVKKLGLVGHEVKPDGRDIPEVLERATYHQDGPTAGPGIYTQWHVMRTACGRVKVLLDGQGGDELFAGYFYNFMPYVHSLIRRVRRGDAQALYLLWRAYREVEPLTGTNPVKDVIKHGYKKRRGRVDARWRQVNRLIDRLRGPTVAPAVPTPWRITSDALLAELDDKKPPPINPDALTSVLWDEIVRTSLPGLLQYEDRDSMAFSIEARVPFLDHRLVEYSFKVPAAMKIEGSRTKSILRDAMGSILPPQIRDRSDKMGYPTPFSKWIRTMHGDWIKDILLSKRADERGLTNRGPVEKMITEHLETDADHSWPIYRLVTLELFYRRFIDQPFVAETKTLAEPLRRAPVSSQPATPSRTDR